MSPSRNLYNPADLVLFTCNHAVYPDTSTEPGHLNQLCDSCLQLEAQGTLENSTVKPKQNMLTDVGGKPNNPPRRHDGVIYNPADLVFYTCPHAEYPQDCAKPGRRDHPCKDCIIAGSPGSPPKTLLEVRDWWKHDPWPVFAEHRRTSSWDSNRQC
ncbi:hypothetical protein K440DRAFT_612934 [Wilcoxina mikolae CBS 423.85]|nr:hypothetical protein K440DRAFT_612934 [Wilcoxina mikolae CBS 423.85]